MIDDVALPAAFPAPATTVEQAGGLTWVGARWTDDQLANLARQLRGFGGESLQSIDEQELLEAWSDTVEAFRDPRGEENQQLAAALATTTGLSAAGLRAALETVLGGVARPHAEVVLRPARPRRHRGLVLVVLASNLPGLAVQPLLPLLAARRPTLLKSSTREPLFTPAFVRALTRRLPAVGAGVAAVTWPGGDEALERRALAAADRIVAFGGREAVVSLEARAPGRVLDYGPKLSLAVVGRETTPAAVAAGLARDVALFDQRGCLSIQAVYTTAKAEPLARALSEALQDRYERWPPGPLDQASAARAHQLRAEAQMRGLWVAPLPLAVGTVVVEPLPTLMPSPGLRTVRIHPLERLEQVPPLLSPWAGRLQGAALAGADAWALGPALAAVGISRLAPTGELHATDARWLNGGRDLLELLDSAEETDPPPPPEGARVP